MALETLIPDTPETKETTQFATSKAPVSKSPYAITGGGTPTGVDPQLLENMQKMIAEREAQKNSFLETIKDVTAWGGGGVNGPSESLARRQKEREEQEATTFGMKSQIAQYKAQQALAQRTQGDVLSALDGGAGAPGTGGGFNTQIDPALKKQIRDLAATDPAAARKLLQDHTKKMAEYTAQARMNPKSYEKTIEVRKANGGLEIVSLVELLNNPQKYQPTEKGSVEVQTQTSGAAPTGVTGNAAEIAKSTGAPIISGDRDFKAQSALYNESVAAGRPGRTASGNPIAKPGTSKHETGNAIDVDMKRATPEQIAALKAKGFTQPMPDKDPNHWELTAAPATTAVPAPGAAATPAFNQIKPMPAMPQSAPLAPPEFADNFPVVAGEEKQAVSMTPAAPAGAPAAAPSAPVAVAPAPAPAPAAPRAPITPVAEKTIPQLRAEAEADAAYQKEAAIGAGKNLAKQQEEFEANINPTTVIEKRAANKRIIELVMGSPNSVGILQKPGMGPALATLAKNGLNTPSGAIGVKELEDALALVMPGTDQKTINARNEIKQNLARGELEASKLAQGQGSVSDFERELFKKVSGSTADTPELLIKRQQALVARENLNEKLGYAYGDFKSSGKAPNLAAFKSSPQFKALVKEYDVELNKILSSNIDIPKDGKTAPASGKTPGGIQFKVITPAKT